MNRLIRLTLALALLGSGHAATTLAAEAEAVTPCSVSISGEAVPAAKLLRERLLAKGYELTEDRDAHLSVNVGSTVTVYERESPYVESLTYAMVGGPAKSLVLALAVKLPNCGERMSAL